MTCRHVSGDVDAARMSSAFVAEGAYSVPLIQQSCMGTAGCIAEFDLNQNLTIWAKTQIPFLAQRDFNRALEELGLVGRNTRVVVPALGGGEKVNLLSSLRGLSQQLAYLGRGVVMFW